MVAVSFAPTAASTTIETIGIATAASIVTIVAMAGASTTSRSRTDTRTATTRGSMTATIDAASIPHVRSGIDQAIGITNRNTGRRRNTRTSTARASAADTSRDTRTAIATEIVRR